MEAILFMTFAAVAIGGAIGMVISRQAVTSAVNLIVVMFALAALFAMQDAHLIAALQVLVYAGAIMVLFLFVIMLLNVREKEGRATTRNSTWQIVAILGLTPVITPVMAFFSVADVAHAPEAPADFGTTAGVGKILYTSYLLPFEVASVLLLAALVGAVILTKTKLR
ncbi:MAG: NADH-quinone oxidoreductase subunit J [Nitrospinae bacterium]|nr:NADH-quinone oxidoreductase subunit J [Nitrospinota bacterium]